MAGEARPQNRVKVTPLVKFKSNPLFLVDSFQRHNLDAAGLLDHVLSWLELPPIDVGRAREFVMTFRPAANGGEVEGHPVFITEDHVAACLKLPRLCGPGAIVDGERVVHRVSTDNLAQWRKSVKLCFRNGEDARVEGSGWRRSELVDECKDVINFMEQRMWLKEPDTEYVDEVVLESALGVMKEWQYGWARFISRRMRDDILSLRNNDGAPPRVGVIRWAQYLSILIEHQIGPRPPPLPKSVNVLDLDVQLQEKELQIRALSKELAVLEEENKQLRQDVARGDTRFLESEEHWKSQLAKSKTDLEKLRTDWMEERRAGAAEMEATKQKLDDVTLDGQNTYLTYEKLKASYSKVEDELRETKKHKYPSQLQEKEQQILALSKSLALSEDKCKALQEDVARGATRLLESEQQWKSQLAKSKSDLEKLRTVWMEDQRVGAAEMEAAKQKLDDVTLDGQNTYLTYEKLKASYSKLEDELRETKKPNYPSQLQEKEQQILALSKKLALTEEKSKALQEDVARGATRLLESEQQWKSQVAKSKSDLEKLKTVWMEEQRVGAAEMEATKQKLDDVTLDAHNTYLSYKTVHASYCKLEDQLKETQKQVKLKEPQVQRPSATQGPLSISSPAHLPNHPTGGIPWEAVWTAADNHYLGHVSNLFDVTSDFPYPKWEALWWIAKDHGQSPPPLGHPSLSHYYSRNATRMSPSPPEEVATNPRFCDCPRRWMWAKDAKLDGLYYNWPQIPLDLSSSQACSAAYYRFYQMHKGHSDPVCFRASIFCAVLSRWCAKFKLVIDANKGGKGFQDMMLYVKLNYCSCRVQRLLELMCQMQFLYDCHTNMVVDLDVTRYGIAENWRSEQRKRKQMSPDTGNPAKKRICL